MFYAHAVSGAVAVAAMLPHESDVVHQLITPALELTCTPVNLCPG